MAIWFYRSCNSRFRRALSCFLHSSTIRQPARVLPCPGIKVEEKKQDTESYNKAQSAVLKNPLIWILALSSAFMYISRYAVNSWGIFYLENEKGYTTIDASFIISINSILGIVGTVSSGLVSDKIFKGNRYLPAVIFGLLNALALCLFLLIPGHHLLGLMLRRWYCSV